MPAIVRSEFALALNQVATERGIDPTVVLESIQAAILAAYRKDYGTDDLEELTVELNPDNGEAKIFKDKKDITPPGFGRIAAQTAKQVILQRIREAEKQAILTDFSAKVGSIVSGMILRFDGPNVVVDIGRAQAVMPPQEQIPSERYRLNQRLTFYIEGIRETYRGNEIIVSRAHKGLVIGLFKREVPEVSQGAVEIKDVAREPGSRSKVAVHSVQAGVDPVGSCVGQKGVRVQAVIGELGGAEKIDIIQWSDNPAQFITASLSPAKEVSVELNDKTKTAVVTVPEDQLSLAIGREGQNVRLASRLSGWRIDLKGKAGEVVSGEGEKTETKTDDVKTAEVGTHEAKEEKAASETNPPVTATPAEVASNQKSTDEAGAAPTTTAAVTESNAPEAKSEENASTENTAGMNATEKTAEGIQSQDTKE